MKITRKVDGVDHTFELTAVELREAYEEQEHSYDMQDAINHINEMAESGAEADYLNYGLCYDEAIELVDDIADEKRRNMNKYDMSWEYALDEAIKTVFEENSDELPDEVLDAMREAAEENISLKFMQYHDKEHQDCLWYGGHVATATRDNIRLEIYACGDVIGDLCDNDGNFIASVKDKSNHGRFYEAMYQHIKGDKALHKIVSDNTLKLVNNNWYEWRAYDTTSNEEVGPDALTNIFEESDMLLEVVAAENLSEVFAYVDEYRKKEVK